MTAVGGSEAIKTQILLAWILKSTFLLNFSMFVEVKSCDFRTQTHNRAREVTANVQ